TGTRSLGFSGLSRTIESTFWSVGMTSLAIDTRLASATAVTVTEDTLAVDLEDGRTVSVPLAWFPRLLDGSLEERKNWRLIGHGSGINWPDLDEDISIEGLIL